MVIIADLQVGLYHIVRTALWIPECVLRDLGP